MAGIKAALDQVVEQALHGGTVLRAALNQAKDVLFRLGIHAQSSDDEFTIDLLAVDHQYRQASQFVDSAFAQRLQRTACGLNQLAADGALTDTVAVREVLDGLVVFAGADPVDELLVDAVLATWCRLKTLIALETHLVSFQVAQALLRHRDLLAGDHDVAALLGPASDLAIGVVLAHRAGESLDFGLHHGVHDQQAGFAAQPFDVVADTRDDLGQRDGQLDLHTVLQSLKAVHDLTAIPTRLPRDFPIRSCHCGSPCLV